MPGNLLKDVQYVKQVLLHWIHFDKEGAKAILKGIRKKNTSEKVTNATMGRSMKMSKYQQLISYKTCHNSGGKKVLRNTCFPWKL